MGGLGGCPEVVGSGVVIAHTRKPARKTVPPEPSLNTRELQSCWQTTGGRQGAAGVVGGVREGLIYKTVFL